MATEADKEDAAAAAVSAAVAHHRPTPQSAVCLLGDTKKGCSSYCHPGLIPLARCTAFRFTPRLRREILLSMVGSSRTWNTDEPGLGRPGVPLPITTLLTYPRLQPSVLPWVRTALGGQRTPVHALPNLGLQRRPFFVDVCTPRCTNVCSAL